MAAKERLHEASAAIGVATSNMLPQLNLTGSYGSQTNNPGDMFTSGAQVWSFGGSVLQPLFHGGQLLHSKRATIAAYDKAAQQYQGTVLNAFKDVADALKALQFDAEALAAQVNAEFSAKNSLDLAQTQFSSGAISYPQLLDAQRTYQQARIGLVQAQAARLADTAALFQSLGGSMQDYEQPELEVAQNSEGSTNKKTNFISKIWQKIKSPLSNEATAKMPEHE
jgi:outer membrane protein TolC